MKKNTQIIVRMTEQQKNDLDVIARKDGKNISKLVRGLVFEYIRQHTKK